MRYRFCLSLFLFTAFILSGILIYFQTPKEDSRYRPSPMRVSTRNTLAQNLPE
jgi:hypothetical protein